MNLHFMLWWRLTGLGNANMFNNYKLHGGRESVCLELSFVKMSLLSRRLNASRRCVKKRVFFLKSKRENITKNQVFVGKRN